jgi:RHS repeat-associated protein
VVVKDDAGTPLESYSYGASRQRLQTISGSLTTYYAWGGSSVLCEYTETTGNGATFAFKKSYIYAGSRLLSTQIWNGTAEVTKFHHPDRLGTKLVTNNAAGTHYEQSTLPFGTALNAESSGFSNQVFTSYDRSAGTGLDYAQNRSYSSGQGRFTMVDPIGASASSVTNPQSNNLYAYVGNSPIDFVDPSGLKLAFYDVRRGMGCVLMGDGKFHCTEYIDRYWYDDGTGGGGGGKPDGGSSGGGGGTGENGSPQSDEIDECQTRYGGPVLDAIALSLQKFFGKDAKVTDPSGKTLGKINELNSNNLLINNANAGASNFFEVGAFQGIGVFLEAKEVIAKDAEILAELVVSGQLGKKPTFQMNGKKGLKNKREIEYKKEELTTVFTFLYQEAFKGGVEEYNRALRCRMAKQKIIG